MTFKKMDLAALEEILCKHKSFVERRELFNTEFARFDLKKIYVLGGQITAQFRGSKRTFTVLDAEFADPKSREYGLDGLVRKMPTTKYEVHEFFISRLMDQTVKHENPHWARHEWRQRQGNAFHDLWMEVLKVYKEHGYQEYHGTGETAARPNYIRDFCELMISDEILEVFKNAVETFTRELAANREALAKKQRENTKAAAARGVLKKTENVAKRAFAAGVTPEDLLEVIKRTFTEETIRGVQER